MTLARRRTVWIAGLLSILCFGVYGALASPELEGYEGETAAVSEGIARGYGARVPPDTQLYGGEEGRRGRTGILQPILMLPFYAAGAGIDEVLTDGDDYTYRSFLARLYGAAVTALGVAVLFLLVRALGRSEGWALAIALLFAFASLALPYAGIGMEPTGMLVVTIAFLAAAHAARSQSLWLWALTGFLVSLAASTRPSTLLGALGALALLWPPLNEAEHERRVRLLAAVSLPIVLGGVAFLAYNFYRFDEPFETGYGGIRYGLGEAPFAALGLYLSPGKGLLWYSPLTVLGILGLFAMWRRERTIAISLTAGLALGTLPYLTTFWSDETWGPRYLASVAWMLLVPIAWWATSPRRRRILGGAAAIAVFVQLAATLVSYNAQMSVLQMGEYTGTRVFGGYYGLDNEKIPYGDDPIRWIPELSPLLFNTEALVSIAARNIGLGDLEASYEPFRGRHGSADLSQIPLDVWWNPGSPTGLIPKPTPLWLIPFGLLATGGALGLAAVGAGRPQRPDRAEPA